MSWIFRVFGGGVSVSCYLAFSHGAIQKLAREWLSIHMEDLIVQYHIIVSNQPRPNVYFTGTESMVGVG